jgi:hypothetical protein
VTRPKRTDDEEEGGLLYCFKTSRSGNDRVDLSLIMHSEGRTVSDNENRIEHGPGRILANAGGRIPFLLRRTSTLANLRGRTKKLFYDVLAVKDRQTSGVENKLEPSSLVLFSLLSFQALEFWPVF